MKLQKMKLKDVRAVKCIPMREGESENMLNAQLSEFNGKIIAVAESNTRKDGYTRIAHCGFKSRADLDTFGMAFYPDSPSR